MTNNNKNAELKNIIIVVRILTTQMDRKIWFDSADLFTHCIWIGYLVSFFILLNCCCLTVVVESIENLTIIIIFCNYWKFGIINKWMNKKTNQNPIDSWFCAEFSIIFCIEFLYLFFEFIQNEFDPMFYVFLANISIWRWHTINDLFFGSKFMLNLFALFSFIHSFIVV